MRQVSYLVASLAGSPLIALMIFSGWKHMTLWTVPIGAIMGVAVYLGYKQGFLETQARLIQARSNSFIGRSTSWLSLLFTIWASQMVGMSIFYAVGHIAHRLL